jgi:hypothetical protein
MTLGELGGIVLRRWYVVSAAFIAALLLGGVLWSQSGVYSTRTVVSLTFPFESTLTPDNATSNESVVAFAGAVAAQISPETETVRYSAGDAPYYGAGLRQGVLVGLRDEGSQWAPSYGSAVIEIQIVGPTERWVADRQKRILDRVAASTEERQSDVASGIDDRVVARVDPLTTQIEHITPSRLALLTAVGAIALAGALVGGWGAYVIEQFTRRRRRRPARGHMK